MSLKLLSMLVLLHPQRLVYALIMASVAQGAVAYSAIAHSATAKSSKYADESTQTSGFCQEKRFEALALATQQNSPILQANYGNDANNTISLSVSKSLSGKRLSENTMAIASADCKLQKLSQGIEYKLLYDRTLLRNAYVNQSIALYEDYLTQLNQDIQTEKRRVSRGLSTLLVLSQLIDQKNDVINEIAALNLQIQPIPQDTQPDTNVGENLGGQESSQLVQTQTLLSDYENELYTKQALTIERDHMKNTDVHAGVGFYKRFDELDDLDEDGAFVYVRAQYVLFNNQVNGYKAQAKRHINQAYVEDISGLINQSEMLKQKIQSDKKVVQQTIDNKMLIRENWLQMRQKSQHIESDLAKKTTKQLSHKIKMLDISVQAQRYFINQMDRYFAESF